jgi:TolB-like protein/Tfp pilus assembly protein PilF
MKKFIEELKRRNVIKASLAYLVIAWVLLQVFEILLPMLGAPEWLFSTLTLIMLIMAIGFPIWIIVSWVYDITPRGIEKTTKESGSELVTQATNKRLNAFIIISLSIAVIVMGLKLSDVFTSGSDKQYAIAVLPFKDMSPEDTQWFCDGVMDEILNHFSTMKSLRVISRTSSDTYKGTDKKIPEIAKELNVDYVLEGSVTLYNNEVKIMAQLIKANDEHVWSKDYNANFDDIFKIQQNVSKDIFKKLKITLSPEEKETLEKLPTQDMEAYQLVLKGREFAKNINKEDLEKSIELYEQAIALDSNYAGAYAEIAQSHYLLRLRDRKNSKSHIIKAKNYVEKALNIDPDTFRAYAVRARIISNEKGGNRDESNENFEKAIALNPNDTQVRFQYAMNFFDAQDYDNGILQYTLAQKTDPLNSKINHYLFNKLLRYHKIIELEEFYNRMRFVFSEEDQFMKEAQIRAYKNKDWMEAIRFYEERIEKDPNNSLIYKQLGLAYDEILNDDINAIKYVKKAYKIDSTNSSIAELYSDFLIEGEKFAEAHKLMQSKNFKTVINKKQQLIQLWYYYYHQENYKKALEVLKDSLLAYDHHSNLLTYAQLGDKKRVDSLLYNTDYDYSRFGYTRYGNAFIYAVLKEKESMYHYLEELFIDDLNAIRGPNGRREFDPYRKEERYKALLRKHYLPITHWNE